MSGGASVGVSRATRIRGVIALATSVGGVVGAVSSLRNAKRKKDPLALVNAIASAVSTVTGVLLAIRLARKGEITK